MASIRCDIDFVQDAHCMQVLACMWLFNAHERNGPIPCLSHVASGMRAMVVVNQIDMVHRWQIWCRVGYISGSEGSHLQYYEYKSLAGNLCSVHALYNQCSRTLKQARSQWQFKHSLRQSLARSFAFCTVSRSRQSFSPSFSTMFFFLFCYFMSFSTLAGMITVGALHLHLHFIDFILYFSWVMSHIHSPFLRRARLPEQANCAGIYSSI